MSGDGARDVAVVGGGVIGVAAARALAVDHDVTVLERDDIAAGATALAAGEVTMTPTYTDVAAVAEHANQFFRAYDGTGAFAYHERESLELVLPGREDAARRRAERLAADGFDVEYLEPEAVDDRYPRIDADRFASAVRQGGNGFLDPYTLATTLADDARERGASLRTGVTVTGFAVEDDSVVGVETTDGRVAADAVVAAAGWRTPDLLDDRLALPVRPYRTQCVVLEPGDSLDDGFPMGWIPGEGVYFRPERNGDLLVGGASVAVDDPGAASRDADEAFREQVATLLPRIARGFDDAGYVDGWAGVDGATPDTRPIVDAPAEGPDGLVVATGFHGRGVMTAPVAATAVRSLLTGHDAPFPLEPFRLDRFDDRSPDFEFVSISAGDY